LIKAHEWQYYSKEHGSMRAKLRPTFMSLLFNCDKNAHLKEAIDYVKAFFVSKNRTKDPLASEVPTRFIPRGQLKYLVYKKPVQKNINRKTKVNTKLIDIKRYEIMLYRSIAGAIKSGSLFVSDNVNYRHLEDELIPFAIWHKNKAKLLKDLEDCLQLTSIVDLFNEKENILEGLYRLVNERIRTGDNTDIKRDKKNKIK